jgi:hypothetical protein
MNCPKCYEKLLELNGIYSCLNCKKYLEKDGKWYRVCDEIGHDHSQECLIADPDFGKELPESQEDDEFAKKYPEHIKLEKVKAESKVVVDFLTWAQGSGISLCTYSTRDERWQIWESIQKSLEIYFKIDPKRLEEEKVAMLDEIIKQNGA